MLHRMCVVISPLELVVDLLVIIVSASASGLTALVMLRDDRGARGLDLLVLLLEVLGLGLRVRHHQSWPSLSASFTCSFSPSSSFSLRPLLSPLPSTATFIE